MDLRSPANFSQTAKIRSVTLQGAECGLKDTNQAKELWESFKRTTVNCADQWQRDKALGLSSAYVPPELLPEAEVAIERKFPLAGDFR